MTISSAIDGCVFHDWASKKELGQYMPKAWRELLVDRAEIGSTLRARPLYQNPLGAKDSAAYPATGVAGSGTRVTFEEVLSRGPPERVVIRLDARTLTTGGFPLLGSPAGRRA